MCAIYCRSIRDGFYKGVVVPVKTAADLTAVFVKDNWSRLVAVVIAWGIIVAVVGSAYGFDTTAGPLATGLGIGAGAGLVAGVIVVKATRGPDKNHLGKYIVQGVSGPREVSASYIDHFSLWGLANNELTLVPAGTRSLVTALLINVIFLPLIPFIPAAIGGVIGFIATSYLVTRIAYWELIKNQPDPTVQDRLHKDQTAIDTLQRRLDLLEARNSATSSSRGAGNTTNVTPL